MRQTPIDGSRMALAVLMFSSVAGSEQDPEVRVDDPVGPRLFRRGDGRYGFVGSTPAAHPLFRRLVERSDPGAYGFNVGRLLCMDGVVREEAAKGLDQVVILGAGYDTRAYRMADELGGAVVFEVDLPAMSHDKRSRLEGALPSPPQGVRYVEVDFTHQDLFERLAAEGYEEGGRTLFVLSGVSMYLPEEALLKLLSDVAAQRGPRVSIVFDYMFDDLRTHPERYTGAKQFISRATKAGEEIRYGIARGKAGEVLGRCGLRLLSHLEMGEVADRHLRRSDGTLLATPYGFAAIAHAAPA